VTLMTDETYTPNPIFVRTLAHLSDEDREVFAEALGDAIEEVAEAKAKAAFHNLWRADYRVLDLTLHPWKARWFERDADSVLDEPLCEVEITIDDLLRGPDIAGVIAMREAREAQARAAEDRAAQEAAEKRARAEALRASARAKFVAAGITLEEQVALGITGYIVR
jgi:hypothetical protein